MAWPKNEMKMSNVKIKDLKPVPWYPLDRMDDVASLNAAIKKTRFTEPIIIDEDMHVIDGMRRVAVYKQNGEKTIPAVTVIPANDYPDWLADAWRETHLMGDEEEDDEDECILCGEPDCCGECDESDEGRCDMCGERGCSGECMDGDNEDDDI